MTNACLYDDLFRSPGGSDVFSGEAHLAAMLNVEAALAQAEARLGLVPASAAQSIASCCNLNSLNIRSLMEQSASAGNLAIPLVKQLTTAVRQVDREAAGYVHWGATSQDIIDTALVLQLKRHLEGMLRLIDSVCAGLEGLSERYASTVMPGRTWLQQAVPITFGLKAASFLDAFLRHRERLRELRTRILTVQFGGASGTLASLNDRGSEVAAALAGELGLETPAIPWHAQRDRIAEVATFHGLITGTLGKLGRDVSLSMQTELNEVSEPVSDGRGGSSTMPHKRNPVSSAILLTAALRAPGLVATILGAMVQEHERGLGGWHAEWETLPELCSLTTGALQRAAELLPHLTVDEAAMGRNLNATRGLLMTESVSMRLAEHIGRAQAHALLQDAARRAMEQDEPLFDALLQSPGIAAHLNEATLRELLEPASYLGSARTFIAQVLAAYRRACAATDGES